ncbi:copper resistance system multicopper oxidase [Pelagibius sp. 7325]|uniref:copper resistance system multicopper oxidase n=1 Tax=Pelagibius sp. 7325 TaxID=3131994 RepID=UPI0030EF0DBC
MKTWLNARNSRAARNTRAAFAAVGVVTALLGVPPALAGTYDLTIGETTINVSGSDRTALAINGTVPGPTLRFKEGEDLVINVTNTLDEDTSIHWHGLIVPTSQDGVPGLSFDGIKPGTTHTYRFPAQQSGTYWFHSHSGLQEQSGVYGSIVIEPQGREPFRYDREYVVVLSDWHDTKPEKILANLKKQSDYYNYNQRTLLSLFDEAEEKGFDAALADRLDWGGMRMTPTDIADISGYTFLVNGKNPEQNWTGLFAPGERVRLRFINAAAMTYFDVRIPGLEMTVVQADGNNVQPVKVDEFRIAVAETYDVIVRPMEDQAYTLVAEPLERGGLARGTLAPRDGMTAEVPGLRPRPLLTMADMSHGDMEGMDHAAMGHSMPAAEAPGAVEPPMSGMDHAAMGHGTMPQADGPPAQQPMSGMDHAAMGHAMPPASADADPFYAPGSGLTPKAANGGKFLSYADLKAQRPLYEVREPTREIEIRLTGNMERYFWSINDKKYSEAEPIRLTYGERVRFKFVNETMMTHPMHLHGMWTILDNGNGKWNPVKHVVSIAPGTTVLAEVEVDAPGRWAFHCHLMYHMATGMFREVIVEGGPQAAALN